MLSVKYMLCSRLSEKMLKIEQCMRHQVPALTEFQWQGSEFNSYTYNCLSAVLMGATREETHENRQGLGASGLFLGREPGNFLQGSLG